MKTVKGEHTRFYFETEKCKAVRIDVFTFRLKSLRFNNDDYKFFEITLNIEDVEMKNNTYSTYESSSDNYYSSIKKFYFNEEGVIYIETAQNKELILNIPTEISTQIANLIR